MTASVSGMNFLVFWSTFFRFLRAASVNRFPVLYDRRHISASAVIILPSPCVDIFSPAE